MNSVQLSTSLRAISKNSQPEKTVSRISVRCHPKTDKLQYWIVFFKKYPLMITPPSFVQNTAEASSPNTPPEANSERREIQNLCELTRSSQMNTAEASSPNTPPEANSESREIQNLCELTRSSQMNTAEASSPNTPPEANSESREI
ncbi:hypothetical protein AVEN_19169-1, partial [Araneus ventricosus]